MDMGVKEILLGSNWDKKSMGEKMSRVSKMIDVGTVFAALIASGVAPALASAAITASVTTYAGAEMYDSTSKRRKRK